jgi:membrane protein required for colicin V production
MSLNLVAGLLTDFTFIPETNWVDVIVVILLIRGGYIGFAQGFSVEFFKTLGAVTATVSALLFYEDLAAWLTSYAYLPLQISRFISFSALVISLLLVFKVVRILVIKILHLELLGKLERWAGVVLAMARSIIVASLLLFVLALLPVDYIKESVAEKSFFGPYLQPVAPKVVEFIVMFKPKNEEELEGELNGTEEPL